MSSEFILPQENRGWDFEQRNLFAYHQKTEHSKRKSLPILALRGFNWWAAILRLKAAIILSEK